MKKITQIDIDNFRAFYESYQIQLPFGENLLLYGENGSGKSSLFKALGNYLASSRNPGLNYARNNYRPAGDNGLIKVSFSDVDPANNKVQAGTAVDFDFGTASVTNGVNFIQDAELTKGFLDYRVLLSVYNHSEPNPNLFQLLIIELLQNYIPPGRTFSLGSRFEDLSLIIRGVYTRKTRIYRNAIADLAIYETVLKVTLDSIFRYLNYFLSKYFKLNLRVRYNLTPLVAPANSWRIVPRELRLDIVHNGIHIVHQSDYLNEARLSALAVCLYLSALKLNPINIDYKILFLDDVFIGLDSGNRLPIAKILNDEFKDYQIFITTYDRNWFEVAQRFFNGHAGANWKSAELYSTVVTLGPINFDKPILLPYEENFDKAIFYLHHKSKPDYPAAANFFRKAAEEVLKLNLPDHETRDENYISIDNYKLGPLVNVGLNFLHKISYDQSLLIELKNALPTLLHPLSHYDLTAQVYKNELEEMQKLIPKLEKYLKGLKNKYRVFIPEGRKFQLLFPINANDTGIYEIQTKETLYLTQNAAGTVSVSLGKSHCRKCYTLSGGNMILGQTFSNNDPNMQYSSLLDCYDKIYNHIHGVPAYSHIPIAPNILTEFEYQDQTGKHSIEHRKNSLVW